VPLWFWNSAEWGAFTQASARTQRPTLVQALRSVRDGAFTAAVTPSHEMRRYLRTLVTAIQVEKNSGNPWKGAGQAKGFRDRLIRWKDGLTDDATFAQTESTALDELTHHITRLLSDHQGDWPAIFSREEVGDLLSKFSNTHSEFGGSDTDILPIDADVPRQFTGDQLLRSIEATAELLGVSEYVETMQMRIRTILSDSRMKIVSGDAKGLALDDWLTNYIGDN
jgi:hypothetical protein